MPEFAMFVEVDSGVWAGQEKTIEATRRDKAAEIYYDEGNGQRDTDKILVANTNQLEEFALAKTVKSVAAPPKQKRRRRTAPDVSEPQETDPDLNAEVDGEAQDASPFAEGEPIQHGTEPDSSDGVRGFGTRSLVETDNDPEE